MQEALEAVGLVDSVDFRAFTIPHSSDHAFAYWSKLDRQYPNAQFVNADVKNYLKAVIGPF